MIIGLGIGIPFRKNSIAAAFGTWSPSKLFSSGEQGAWYDPSDLTTLYQDSAGTTPVTAVEQPVGLMLDKSKGLVLGPELVTNGSFDTNVSGWTANTATTSMVFDAGTLKFTRIAGGKAFVYTQLTTVVGKTYSVSGAITACTPSDIGLLYFSASNSTSNPADGRYSSLTPAVGVKPFIFIASATTTYLHCVIDNVSATGSANIDNISVRELPGNHAYQTTSISRPTLSARVNLLSYTENFGNAYWVADNCTIAANATSDPLGGNTANKIQENTTAFQHGVYNASSFTPIIGVSYTWTVYAKKAERSWLWIDAYTNANAATFFDLQNGVVGQNAAGSTASMVESPVGSGWWKCSVTRTATASTNLYIGIRAASGDGVPSYQGVLNSGIYIWGADLRVANDGIDLPPYQRVGNTSVTPSDYDTVGFPKYLRFDGIDDFLQTSSINFTSTDKMTVFAGVRKFREADEIICELGTNYTDFGGFYFNNYATAKFVYGGRGQRSGVSNDDALWTVAAPVTAVMTAQQGINLGLPSTLRGNGVLRGSSINTTFGGGTFGNYPLYIGRRGGTSLALNGRIYGIIVRGSQSSNSEIVSAESYMNGKTKAF